MAYTVTIKNDAQFSNGHGIVHTWLELNSSDWETIYRETDAAGAEDAGHSRSQNRLLWR